MGVGKDEQKKGEREAKFLPYEFFCKVARASSTCTVLRGVGGGTCVAVGTEAAAWIDLSPGHEMGDFCLSVEGGVDWGHISGWRWVLLAEAGVQGVKLSSGEESIFFEGRPWVMGNDLPDEFRSGGGVARWIFDSEIGGAKAVGGGDGVVFGKREVSLIGGGLEVLGVVVSSPFEASIPLGAKGGAIVAAMVNGGGRFTADLHGGRFGPLVVRGAKGGVAVASMGS